MTDSSVENASMIPPSPWVVAHAPHIPAGGRVLDLACGRGRHTRWLAGLGYRVLAVDRDQDALSSLAGLAGVETRIADLEGGAWPLAGQRFEGIVVTNYLWRPHLGALVAMLRPGGVLIYETFMRGNEAHGKPSRPDFLLAPGELRAVAAAAGLQEIAFAEGYTEQPKPAVIQSLCAVLR